jgi:SAM-dependent methyltransferase
VTVPQLARVVWRKLRWLPRRLRERRDAVLFKLRSRPRAWRPEVPVDRPNMLFSRRAARELQPNVQRLAWRDPQLLHRLSDTRIEGVRAWEYGVLIGCLSRLAERRSWRCLDVGSGASTFPAYLLEHGWVASMTTLDLEEPFEPSRSALPPSERIERVAASMLDIPFPDGSFDLVTCISAIEHLDGDPQQYRRDPERHPPAPYERYRLDTRRALEEMMRVVRPGGYLYLTTDAYLADRQTTDRWSSPDGTGPIWSAYRYEDIDGLFVRTLEDGGFQLVGGHDFDATHLVDDPDRSTYRGRFFTTFALFAQSPATAAG